MLSKVYDIITIVANNAGRIAFYVSATFLFLMMVLTGLDVTGRYFFNAPVQGSFEITTLFMSIIVALGLSYCALEKAHVRVDIITMNLSQKVQTILDCITNFFSFALCALITWQIIPRAVNMIDANITTLVLRIPVFPFVFIVCLGMAVLSIVFLKDLIEDIYKVTKK
jgi:TRAP-type C4-dicarboxylate transport system permease small subunit